MSLLFPVSFTLIAEDAAPVCLADALPRVAVAVAVLAARIGDALVAKFAFPAPSASDLKKKEIILKKSIDYRFFIATLYKSYAALNRDCVCVWGKKRERETIQIRAECDTSVGRFNSVARILNREHQREHVWNND